MVRGTENVNFEKDMLQIIELLRSIDKKLENLELIEKKLNNWQFTNDLIGKNLTWDDLTEMQKIEILKQPL